MPDIEQQLRSRGVRATQARLAVWEALRRMDGHATAEQVADRLDGTVNLASVYRSLALFEALGFAEHRPGPGDAAVWETTHADDQVHLICQRCGAVTHHPVGDAATLLAHVSDDHGFEVTRVSLTLEGACADCRD